jgi:hypothetical protein
MAMLELIVLVADKDAEFTVKTLIEARAESLAIHPIRFDDQQASIIRHERHDAGTYAEAHQILRPYVGKTAHVLVVLDREGSGKDTEMSASEIETDIASRLIQNGWSPEQIAVIVLDPELEIWVWSKSPHVKQILNVTDEQLARVFTQYPRDERGKPSRPKEAMREALRLGNKPPSASLFKQLAEKVSLNASERAFDRLKTTLQAWFPPEK